MMEKFEMKSKAEEGGSSSGWILMDFGKLVCNGLKNCDVKICMF